MSNNYNICHSRILCLFSSENHSVDESVSYKVLRFEMQKCKILLDFTSVPSFKDVLSSLKQNIYISNKPSAFFIKGLWTLDSHFVVLSPDPTKPHLIKGIDQTNNTGKLLLSKNKRFSWTCFEDIDKFMKSGSFNGYCFLRIQLCQHRKLSLWKRSMGFKR